MGLNFTACRIAFEQNATNLDLYSYSGPVPGLNGSSDRQSIISEEGCRTLCGTGSQLYTWGIAANTITTWVLPIIGLILQAPFESNQFRKTFLAACRWVGSPIASLSYIFWNIKITGKCAIMVDMATGYNEFPDPNSEFRQLRDSFYILSVMNQYVINPAIDRISAEKILRIALFENNLRLPNTTKTLTRRREKLAGSLRSGRKRGVVPVFISTLWFLLSLAISIHSAFGNIGMNATAHNLAIGLLLGWLPVLILSSITDRSPASTDQIRLKLNRLLESVRLGLLNEPDPRWNVPHNHGEYPIAQVEYFTDFGGQGRTRWHYGVAHPILVGIEDDFAAGHGRGWLSHRNARRFLISRPNSINDLLSFDFRELWHVISALVIVGSSVFSAFIISYFTPTVGLSCRSGGYMIFFILALTSFAAESLLWWPLRRESVTRRQLGYLLSLIEVTNTSWLVYILGAQTFGLYQTCSCWSSSWARGGGYINFKTTTFYKEHAINTYWSTGTVLACAMMALGFFYIVAEWCTQSHLWTEDYDKATAGLRSTRRFKKYTIWFRCVPDWFINKVKSHRPSFLGKKRGRRSLVWRWKKRN